MFGFDAVRTDTFYVADPQADGTLMLWKAPSRATKIEILEAWAALDTTISSGVGTAVTLRLYDYGAAGTAVGGTITAVLGAAGTGDWTANVPRDFTVSDGTMDGGDYLAVVYEEVGTVAPKNIVIGIAWINGVGA